MLRNRSRVLTRSVMVPFLNEVLSLNAQESLSKLARFMDCTILNEVLSLNAQEWRSPSMALCRHPSSSMKS